MGTTALRPFQIVGHRNMIEEKDDLLPVGVLHDLFARLWNLIQKIAGPQNYKSLKHRLLSPDWTNCTFCLATVQFKDQRFHAFCWSLLPGICSWSYIVILSSIFSNTTPSPLRIVQQMGCSVLFLQPYKLSISFPGGLGFRNFTAQQRSGQDSRARYRYSLCGKICSGPGQ